MSGSVFYAQQNKSVAAAEGFCGQKTVAVQRAAHAQFCRQVRVPRLAVAVGVALPEAVRAVPHDLLGPGVTTNFRLNHGQDRKKVSSRELFC